MVTEVRVYWASPQTQECGEFWPLQVPLQQYKPIILCWNVQKDFTLQNYIKAANIL